MKELEILQQRFSDMAVQFPGVMHVLTIWPKDEKEPKLNPKYMPTQDNLIEIWGNGLIGEYTPGRNMKHWLLKPTHTLWNKDHDVERFRTLVGNAGQVLIEHGFLSHIKVSDSIAKFSEYSLNIRQAAQFWVLVAHELGNSEKSVCDFRDRKAVWMNILGKDASVPKQNYGCYEVQNDFFLESSLVITQLLDLEKEANSKNKEPLSDKALAVLHLLQELPPNQGLTGSKILKKLDGKKIFIEQSTLTKSIIPALKPHGVQNKPRIGYYIDK
jgi:hypothetical protein